MKETVEESSSFFVAPEIPAGLDLSTLKKIHDSQNGCFEIWRVDRMGRFRALKCLKPEHRGDPLYENLLRKEFEIGYSLRHPNICEYYAFGPQKNLGNCIELEWVDGRTLETLVAEGKPAPSLCDKILDELCDALSYIHSKQVLHCDLKPSNILVTYRGDTVKLIDFGFSDSDMHSFLKSAAGTRSYAAPELLAGGQASVRSDIWSLGLIIATLTRSHREVVRKCCEKRPALRYGSVAEVKRALHSRMPLFAGILFLALISAAALLPYFSRIRETKPDSEPLRPDTTAVRVEALVSAADSVPVRDSAQSIPTPKASARPKTQPGTNVSKKSASGDAVDPAVIDELFRQASELFEENR